jgi:hypothetical protein
MLHLYLYLYLYLYLSMRGLSEIYERRDEERRDEEWRDELALPSHLISHTSLPSLFPLDAVSLRFKGRIERDLISVSSLWERTHRD